MHCVTRYTCQVLQYKRKCTELEEEAEAETLKKPSSPSPALSRASPARSLVEKPAVSRVAMMYTDHFTQSALYLCIQYYLT